MPTLIYKLTFLVTFKHSQLSRKPPIIYFHCTNFSLLEGFMMKGKFLKACMRKCRRAVPRAGSCDACCEWSLWPWLHDERIVPSDVPKGHMVVYVGEYQKRFVIKVNLLKHPLFRALLDQAQEAYDFTAADSRLCIPCDENIFLSVVQCAKSPPDRPRLSLCL